MALLTKEKAIDALTRLGAIAHAHGESIELLLVGGEIMALEFAARPSTRDLDVLVLKPADASAWRGWASIVGKERGWPEDWLNDGVKGFMIGISFGPVVFSSQGILVRRPEIEQLLALKLCAWRDDVDIADARRLLRELPATYAEIWKQIVPHLQPGRELAAQYAFDDLWEERHGSH